MLIDNATEFKTHYTVRLQILLYSASTPHLDYTGQLSFHTFYTPELING